MAEVVPEYSPGPIMKAVLGNKDVTQSYQNTLVLGSLNYVLNNFDAWYDSWSAQVPVELPGAKEDIRFMLEALTEVYMSESINALTKYFEVMLTDTLK